MIDQQPAAAPEPIRKRATRRETMMRDARMLRALARGEAIDEVAEREGLTLKRARERVAAAVRRRSASPTEDFVAVQVTRLNEAMLVAYGAMKDGNLAAVDRVVKITREYDRYQGLALTLARGAGGERHASLPPSRPPLALAAPQPPLDSVAEAARRPDRFEDTHTEETHALAKSRSGS